MNQLDQLFNQFYTNAIEDSVKAVGPVERKLALKSRLLELLGDFSYLDETKVDMQPELIETVETDGYIRERITLPITQMIDIPVYVLTPSKKQAAYPAVLALHGHGNGVKEALGVSENGETQQKAGIHSQFAVELVKRGFKVFAPEVIGFGERRLTRDIEAGKQNSCEAMATNLLMEGKTIAGLRIWEARRILDYIETLEDVDRDKQGIMGFSGGALISAYTAALDSRIKATVLTGFTNTFKGSIMAMHHCIDNYIPGILNYAELPEWISLISPRSLFIESGEHDRIFPNQFVKEAITEIEECYHNRQQNFAYDIFPGAHEISGRKAYDWLVNQLD
ncbi:dienelactone hydrolase family protein [Gracilibacillus caseinilyticus]|uniref:Dienelactone hydrolase family protein n=1 Tax=Gracilibacillus caseinilyticus TaxID=2932256 RepID=A0ABY4F1Q5_9BACI|nr:alpha/beta fold hydrolase [Gracilibacillus caseinilyticus]UOQ48341.1 dienelactone hydrolase family protein [Gracilibacillus caseinilyticus]